MKKALLLLFVALFVQTANATIYMVDNNPGSQFPISSVQDALDNYASPTDTIMVIGSTTSYGNIAINFPIALIGEGMYSLAGDTTAFDRITVRSSNVSITGVITAISLDAYNSIGNEIRNVTIERCKIRKSGNGHLIKFVGLKGSSGGYGYFNNINVKNNIIISGSVTFNLGTGANDTIKTQLDTVIFENNIFSQGHFERYINTNSCIGLSTLTIKNNIFINGVWTGGGSLFHHGSNMNRRIQDANIENNIFYQTRPDTCDSCNYRNNLTFDTGGFDTIYTTAINTGNLIANPTDTIFINYPGGTFSFNQNFNLASGSPAINAGSDTTNIGTTGGDFPFVIGEGPKVPLVDHVNISNSTVQQSAQYFLQFDAQTRTDVYYPGTHLSNNDSVPITHAEYWIDSIPIPGTGIAISCNPLDTIFYIDSIPGLVLDTGTHIVSVRARNSFGNWGFIMTDTMRTEFYDLDINIINRPFTRSGILEKYEVQLKNRGNKNIYDLFIILKSTSVDSIFTLSEEDSLYDASYKNASAVIPMNDLRFVPIWIYSLPAQSEYKFNLYMKFMPTTQRKIPQEFNVYYDNKNLHNNLFTESGDTSFFTNSKLSSILQKLVYSEQNNVPNFNLLDSTINFQIDSALKNIPNIFNAPFFIGKIIKPSLNQAFNLNISDSLNVIYKEALFHIIRQSYFEDAGSADTNQLRLANTESNSPCQPCQFNCFNQLFAPLSPISNFKISSRPCVDRCYCQCIFNMQIADEKSHGGYDITINPNADSLTRNDWAKNLIVVKSIYPGTVVKSGWQNSSHTGFGWRVIVESECSGNNFRIIYGHLNPDFPLPDSGDFINANVEIGRAGNSGGSSGPHLHIEIRNSNNESCNPETMFSVYGYPEKETAGESKCEETLPDLDICIKETPLSCDPSTFNDQLAKKCEPGPKNNTCLNPTLTNPLDPNDKVGNEGYATPRYIKPTDELHYGIFFENIDSATAPAQVVHIIDTLDLTKVDASTFYFESITAGEMLIVLPDSEHIQYLDTTFMEEPINGCFVRAQASFNSTTGVIDFLLTSLDTIFLSPDSVGVTEGFLPPDTTNFHGNGLVSFKVMPVSTIPDDTVIYNTANIIFDSNPSIQTATWFNTIDRIEPLSFVNSLPACTYDTSIVVSWTGTDDGAGIVAYDIYAKASGDTAFTKWLSYTSLATDTFPGVLDSTYQFYSIAYDSVGNIENKLPLIEASTTICPAGIDYIYNSADLKIYPNPTTGKLIIEAELEKNGKLNVEIFSLLNQKLLSFDGDDSSNKYFKKEIDLSNQADGVYFLHLKVDGQNVTKKFILKKN